MAGVKSLVESAPDPSVGDECGDSLADRADETGPFPAEAEEENCTASALIVSDDVSGPVLMQRLTVGNTCVDAEMSGRCAHLGFDAYIPTTCSQVSNKMQRATARCTTLS